MTDPAFDPADILGDRLVENGTEIIGEAWSAAVGHLQAILNNGWRIVRTNPVTEPDERVIILEEWHGS